MKKHWYLCPVLLVEGASLMAVELLGAKLVAPFYGNSLYVWTAVLGITVLGLTVGYYFGGIISERYPSNKALFFIYMFAFLEGALVMAIELLTAKMIAPYFGASLYVWGAVIGVTFTSLAIGYYLGGVLARQVSAKKYALLGDASAGPDYYGYAFNRGGLDPGI